MNTSSISPATTKTMNLFEWGLLITLSVLWGGSFLFNGIAVQEIPVFSVVFGRVCIAAVILLLFLKFRGIKFPMKPAILGAFLFMGFANNLVPFSLIVAGQAYIGSGLASVLNATTPLFTAAIVHIFTQDTSERLTPKRIVGIVLGITGVAIMVGPDIGAVGLTGPEVMGQLAVLGAAFSYGVAITFGRRFAKMGISPMVLATGQVSGTTVLMLPLVLIIDQPWQYITNVSALALAAVVAMAIFSTVFAYVLYFKILQTAGATNASLVTLLVPVSAIVLGVLFLGEKLDAGILSGMAFIGAGLLVIDGRVLTYFKRNQPGELPG